MGDKEKHLCKWKQEDLSKDFLKYRKIVRKAKNVCMKCGRAASSEDYLCRPASLKKDTC